LGPRAERFPIGLTVAAAISLAILIGLGVWQLQRLEWKAQVLADVAAAKASAPIPLDEALRLDRPQYRRAYAECPGLGDAAYVELRAIQDGQPGVRLISACPLGARSVLVDRGFVGDTISARPPQTGSGAPMRITGVLRVPDPPNSFTPPPDGRTFYGRDLVAMAAELGAADPYPVFLAAETSSNPQWLALKPTPLPAEISNRHLEYALTWFGLAGALAAVYAAVLGRRLKS